jgi:predicted SAM-dependent methyltransferase
LKLLVKVVLNAIPIPYSFFQKFNVFKHGFMKDPEYCLKAFETFIGTKSNLKEKQILEIGPGDSINTAIIASALGAKRTYLIDKGSFALKTMSTYHDMYNLLIKLGLNTKEIILTNFEEMLENVNAEYLTQGISDMAKIEDNSIDLIFSNAVLEHIDRNEVSQLMFETHRVLKLGCTAQHRVDLRDHINDEFQHLRFSNMLWNSKIMRQGGTNLNRMHVSEYVHLAEAAGFTCKIVANGTFIPDTRMKIHHSLNNWIQSKGSYPGFDLHCIKV